MNRAIDSLARYLTGALVPECSMGIAVGGMAQHRAKLFFELRSSCGVEGYRTYEEARKAITEALAK